MWEVMLSYMYAGIATCISKSRRANTTTLASTTRPTKKSEGRVDCKAARKRRARCALRAARRAKREDPLVSETPGYDTWVRMLRLG